MKWQSFFGAQRYKWLLQDIEKLSHGVGNIMRIDDIFRKVLRTWNPLDSPEELELLRRAIIGRPSGSAVFSVELICLCVSTIGSDDKYYTAWTIVELMRQRRVKDIDHVIFMEQIRFETMCRLKGWIENLVGRIPPINIQITEGLSSDNVGVEKIITDKRMFIKLQLSNEDKIWVMLLNIATLLVDLHNSFSYEREKITFEVRIKILLFLMDHNEFNVLIDSFNFSDYLFKYSKVGTFTI